MISFPKYAKIKDNYCVAYLGQCNEYLLLLNYFIPKLETLYPGINIYLCCRDECQSICDGKRVFPISLLKQRKEELVHVKEINFDHSGHPIEKFLNESGLKDFKIVTSTPPVTTRAVVLTKGNYPTANLNEQEKAWLASKASEEGFTVEFDAPVDFAGYVLGVECYELFRAGMMGIRTAIMPNGVGTGLFLKLFPDTAQILELPGYIKMKTGK